MQAEELDKKTIKGLSWIMLGVGVQHLVDISTKIVLVRLLLPVEFGTIATAYIVINLFRVLNETGISTAIIRRNDVDDESFSTTFFFNILISFISLVSAFILAPSVAAYFKNNSLVPVIRILSLIIFIESFYYVHNTLLMKNLNFKDTVIPELAAVVMYSVSGITLAYLKFGLWSLVWSSLARSIVAVVLYWKLNPWRPKLRFNYPKLKTLLGFGIKVSAIRILRYARNNIGYLVIAKFLGPVALGYYYVAYEVSHYCDTQLFPLLSKIIFPSFGQIEDARMIRRYYFKAVKYISIVGIPVSLIIFALSAWIVLFLYGSKWLPSAVPMQFLSLLGCLKLIENLVFNSLFIAKGNIDKFFKINITMFLINVIAVFIGVSHGITGVAVLSLSAGILNFTIIILSIHPIINHKWQEYAKSLFPGIFSGVIMLVFLLLLRALPYAGAVFLLPGVALALTIYVIMLKLCKVDIFGKIKLIGKTIIS